MRTEGFDYAEIDMINFTFVYEFNIIIITILLKYKFIDVYIHHYIQCYLVMWLQNRIEPLSFEKVHNYAIYKIVNYSYNYTNCLIFQ